MASHRLSRTLPLIFLARSRAAYTRIINKPAIIPDGSPCELNIALYYKGEAEYLTGPEPP